MATHNVETENSAEILFWILFLCYTWHKSRLYWTVSFITSFAIRFSFLGLTKWAYIPPHPWISFGRTIIAITAISGWTTFFLLSLYGLSLTPIHIWISPIDIWTRNSTIHKVTKSIVTVHEPEVTKVDIYAIHGLGSTPERAWTHYEHRIEKINSEEPESPHRRSTTWFERLLGYQKKDVTKIQTKETRWLKDFLPEDQVIQDARIMMLNHDTRWDANAAGQSFIQHAGSMLQAIEDHREKDSRRPIIFIAHSFGGLLLKQMLMTAKQQDSPIVQASRGILFLGVPHSGSEFAFWGSLLSCTSYWRGSSSALLEYMSADGNSRKQLQEDFYSAYVTSWHAKGPNEIGAPRICDFFEQIPERKLGIPIALTATPEHGNIGLGTRVFLDTDHRGLNKFSARDDPNYEKVLKELRKAYELALMNPLKDDEQARKTPDDSACHQVFRTTHYESVKNGIDDPAEGTCRWVLDDPKYHHWLEAEGFELLWVTAEPLCGKSVLSKFLINHFSAKNSISTCYFFFDENSPENRNVNNALCAILHQLFAQNPNLIKHASTACSENGDKLPGLFEPLWKSFAAAILDPGVDTIYCVIDGLDECSPDGRALLLQEIVKLSQYHGTEMDTNGTEMGTNGTEMSDNPKTPGLKLLITSRPDRSIEEGLKGVNPTIESVRLMGEDEGEATLIQGEIDHVIEVKVNDLRQLRKRYKIHDDAHEEVFAKLKQVTNRTYLWISLVFHDLMSKADRSTQELLEVLDSFPAELGQLYETMLSRSTEIETTKKILQMVLAAEEPLTVTEMHIALRIRKEHKSISDMNLEPEATFSGRISQLCGRFLSIRDHRIHFIHSTAKGFLLAKQNEPEPMRGRWKHSIDHRDASLVIAKACITYLSFSVFETRPLTGVNLGSASAVSFTDVISSRKLLSDYVSKHQFLKYAAKNCMQHVSQAGIIDDDREVANLDDAREVAELAYSVSESSNKRFWTWITVCKDGDPLSLREFHSGALSVGCHWGLSPLVKMWLRDNCDRSMPRSIDRSLATASRFGYCRCLELIFDHSDDPGMRLMEDNANRLDGVFKGDTCLHIAARHDHADVVKMLLARRVPLEKVNEEGATAFSDAMAFHALSTAQLLLEAGANPASFNPLLGVAVRHKAYSLANLLLQYGAQPDEVDQATTISKLPIQPGKSNRETFVDFIIGDILDVSRDDLHLVLRARPNRISIDEESIGPSAGRGLHLLMKRYFQYRSQPDRFDQATAVSKFQIKPGIPNRKAFVDFIIGHTLDFEKGAIFSTPLIEAAANGNDEMVTNLIKRGATVNPRGAYITPLKRAIMDLQISTARVLVESGADVHDGGAPRKMPLHFAAEAGSLDLVKLLIDHGADIEARNHRGETPLHLAAGFGYGAVVEHLLDLKASANCVDKSGRTALSRAASTRTSDRNYESCHIFPHAHTVQLLLRARADPNCVDSRRFSALTYSRLPNPRSCILTGTRLEKLQIERAAITQLLAQHGADRGLGPSAADLVGYWKAGDFDSKSVTAENAPNVLKDVIEPPLENHSQKFLEAVEVAIQSIREDRSVASIFRPQDAEVDVGQRLQLWDDSSDIFKPWDQEGTFMATE